MSFTQSYESLNAEQKQAVDQTEGPVMVVAGPGTGKTQLLGVRSANIIASTDALPQNILCLTFTDSAVRTLKARLRELIGEKSYLVAVHTFHGISGEILSRYSDYVWNGAQFSLLEPTHKVELLEGILAKLPHDNPLSAQWEGAYVALKALPEMIDTLKKAGLSPDDLRKTINAQLDYIDKIESIIVEALPARLSMKNLEAIKQAVENLAEQDTSQLVHPAVSLEHVLKTSFKQAYEAAQILGKTGPVSEWKRKNIAGKAGQYHLKEKDVSAKWLAVADVYELYQKQLHQQQLYDYSDMILEAIRLLETNQEVLADLQEQYHYIQADEFQDTNDAQSKLLYLLADNPVHEGQPNLLVVGDDDQAIYKFQGADVGNILEFKRRYPAASLVVLNKNYRSHTDVLQHARGLISQGVERLENTIDEITKDIDQANPNISSSDISHTVLATPELEYMHVAEQIEKQIANGTKPSDIAVIARGHRELKAMSSLLLAKNIPVHYEHKSDVLNYEAVEVLVQMARVVSDFASGNMAGASVNLSQLMCHKMFGYSPEFLWNVSLQAYQNRTSWVQELREDPFINWCKELAVKSRVLPAEEILDQLIGVAKQKDEKNVFSSPFMDFYFSESILNNDPNEYITNLSGLQKLRNSFKEALLSKGILKPLLADFLIFVDAHITNSIGIIDDTSYVSSADSISLLSVHKSKGMEFESVYLLSVVEEIWQNKRGRKTTFPSYLQIQAAGDTDDDHLRLFYVAVTRAKSKLHLTAHTHNSSGKDRSISPFLQNQEFKPISSGIAESALAIQSSWGADRLLPVGKVSLNDALGPRLEKYELSVTHLNTFLNVLDQGPKEWFIGSLLKFPQAKSASGMYGTAVHEALNFAHSLEILDPAKILGVFEKELINQRMNDTDFEFFLGKGKTNLALYLEAEGHTISKDHLSEVNISHEVEVQGARIGGKIDKIIVDEENKTITVIDYKTGKQLHNWTSKATNQALKAWRYKNQLMFYKLLIENSRRWGGKYTVTTGQLVFVEPDDAGKFVTLDLDLSSIPDEFQPTLVGAWKRMLTLDLDFEQDDSMNAVYEFEEKLRNDS